ncbi:MAG: hypothetical protein JWM27_3286 [Gemmatimonadetes bacterium]|nr:hypothetical protein [Gemmatimonadota bacterium]
MLHVTNGDSAVDAMRRAGITGDIVPWRDVLHDGPVPAGLPPDALSAVRARFIAAQGWGDEAQVLRGFRARDAALADFARHDAVVLWFEHDLYDQLQLLQVLDFFQDRDPLPVPLTMVGASEYIGPAAPERITHLFAGRQPVTAAQLALGRIAWRAFREPRPLQWAALLGEDTTALPYLRAAILRQLEQLPSAHNGLSRSERQALEAIDAGAATLADAYRRSHHEREEAIWMGDSTYAAHLAVLSDAPTPLVLMDDGAPIVPPRGDRPADAFWPRRAVLTDAGRDVLAARADHVRLNGIDRWLGGVHLTGNESAWRWDADAGRLVGAGG